MKKELFVFALSALCGLSAEATINIAGVEKQVDTLECRTVGPGVQYVRMHMPEYPLDVYTMTIDLNNPYNDVDAFIGKNHAGSTEAMTSAYTRLSTPEHQSIGSINGNFWIVSGQNMDDRLLGQPHSGCIVNGEIATEPNGWNRAGRGDEIEKLQEIGFVVLDQDKKMWIDDMNFEAKVINAANEKSFDIAEVNRIRNENEIVLYNHFTGQTTSDIDGTDVLIKPIEGASWGLNKDVECVVTRIVQSKGGTELEEGEYALSGNGTGAEFLNQMNVGDKVKINTKLTTRTDNLIPIAEQMLTGNALVMREGKLTPRNENEAYNSQTYSRSGIGMSQDGKTLYLIVIDYKSSTSVGTNTATMCYILKQAGAWNVANMDAGGSAQMMLRGKLVNNPADGKERPVSNGFMIFTNAPEDNTLNSLAFDNYNLEVPSYSCFEPTILGYNSYGVLIDTDVQEFTLSCDASLGTISSDGKKFYASPNATSGYLHVTSGTATGKIKVNHSRQGSPLLSRSHFSYRRKHVHIRPFVIVLEYRRPDCLQNRKRNIDRNKKRNDEHYRQHRQLLRKHEGNRRNTGIPQNPGRRFFRLDYKIHQLHHRCHRYSFGEQSGHIGIHLQNRTTPIRRNGQSDYSLQYSRYLAHANQ